MTGDAFVSPSRRARPTAAHGKIVLKVGSPFIASSTRGGPCRAGDDSCGTNNAHCQGGACETLLAVKKTRRRSPGRPPKEPAERKDEVIRVRLTSEQRDKFERAAREEGMDLSTWMRLVCEKVVARKAIFDIVDVIKTGLRE
jgi:hypothetical protein